MAGFSSASTLRDKLDVASVISSVKSPQAGAVVLFAGTTRDNFEGKPVTHLEYSSYAPLALKTMVSVAQLVKTKHALTAVTMVHRLGVVPIEEESILIAVSAPHRQAAWKGGEEALELCKEKVEVWKLEEFGGDQGGVWRANRDGARGVQADADDCVQAQGQPHEDAGGARSKSPPKSLGLFWVSKGEATEMAEVPTTSGRQLFALLIDPDA
ncbi:MAG: hypothetical protein LQ338_007614 [Usnochroma carphineum]|nr:MAG: hypothetical protein LQ338_007614 [Usnochroma carphineum]